MERRLEWRGEQKTLVNRRITQNEMKMEPNTTISHYKILSEIGKGGMGEVYLAQDTKLNRKVAIKFLSEEFKKDVDKLNRFVLEAQSASALNHPNIITIYEIGEFENVQYIALEYIEGETLNNTLKNKSLKLSFVLETAIQIASALDAAHAANIVHRDIKPDNVMIRPDGLVKILDFGIAKLTEKTPAQLESEDATAIQINTSPGMIIGTANYMSPEQAKGKEVDARTDIFSFGVVLYEMISGELPFEGESPLEIIGSILNKEPKPLDTRDVPPEIGKLVNKTLRKNRNERYQTIKDLLIDLKDIKKELEFQDKLEKTIQPNHGESETQMFQAATAAEQQQTTAGENINDSIAIKKSGLKKVLIGVLAVLLISAMGLSYWYFTKGKQIESIAVMPFVNESGNKEIEYLSDGMTETLISSLTRIPDLSVKANSSVFYYKGKARTPKQLGEELDVQAVLLGKVVQRGENLKLSLELVDTDTQNALWSETFERGMKDLVNFQTEIANQVSQQLKIRLTPGQKEDVSKTYTTNSEANQLYLKGRYHWNKRNPADFDKATNLFKQAIEKDPTYPLPYSGLADVYALMPQYAGKPSKEYMPLAKAAAQKAIELDGTLAEPHASLGYVHFVFEGDFPAAEREFKKAIALNPKYATNYQWYSEYLAAMGRKKEAIENAEKAVELEPLSLIISTGLGLINWQTGNPDEAIKQLIKTKELDPNFASTYMILGLAYQTKRMFPESLENNIKGAQLMGGDTKMYAGLRQQFERNGWDGVWRENLKRLQAQAVTGRNVDFDIAMTYANLRDREKTLEYLERAVEAREWRIAAIGTAPGLEFLKGDPKYKELRRRIGFRE